MTGFLSEALPSGYNSAEYFTQLGDTPFAANALNLVFAPQGAGKSYATVNMCGLNPEMERIAYLDFDENSASFRDHCNSQNVEYVNMSYIGKPNLKAKKDSKWPIELPERLLTVILALRAGDTVIIDSLSSMVPEMDSMNTNVSKYMYSLASIAKKYKLCIVVIDHATIIRDKLGKEVDFKIEGSQSGKLKATAAACRYDAAKQLDKKAGGTFTVVRSRLDTVNVQQQFKIGKTRTVSDAIAFLVSRKLDKDITQSDFTKATCNTRDLWVRGFVGIIYEADLIERTTYLRYRVPASNKIKAAVVETTTETVTTSMYIFDEASAIDDNELR